MIPDSDLKDIQPKKQNSESSPTHVLSGIPIPKVARISIFSPDEWEIFTEEWASSLKDDYCSVRRFGGSGDLGIDIAGFYSDQGFEGKWDNYQCKRYNHSLRPSDVWVEIGKIIYYSYSGEYTAPQKHYFVCSQGIGTALEKLLKKPTELKQKTIENWNQHCLSAITSTAKIPLENGLKKYLDSFDFSIFTSRSIVELIKGHSKTVFHSVRFGGGLPVRPAASTPPEIPTENESRYIRQLLDAYGEHLQLHLPDTTTLEPHKAIKRDYLRQRERFYHAESLKNFARDTVPHGTFQSLQDEIFHGVIDICEDSHSSGFERMKATLAQASAVASTSNPLVSSIKTQDRQGICHQLANENRLKWMPEHD